MHGDVLVEKYVETWWLAGPDAEPICVQEEVVARKVVTEERINAPVATAEPVWTITESIRTKSEPKRS